MVASCFIGAGEIKGATAVVQTMEKLDVMGQLLGKTIQIAGKVIKPVVNTSGKAVKYVLKEGVDFIKRIDIKVTPNGFGCGFPIQNIKISLKNKLVNLTEQEAQGIKQKIEQAINNEGGLDKLPVDENGNHLVEIDVDGEKVTAVVGSEDGLNKIGPSGEITFVKDIITKKVLKVIKKYDPKVGDLVEYPKYNNVALGKDMNGTLEAFGKEVGANIWTKNTDKIFTDMYVLMESRSFERNITDVLNETINQNDGKILFDISNVNIQKAIDGGLIHNTTLVVDERLVTELELQMLLRNENWLNNTIFHNNGKVLSNEEMLNAGIKIIK